VKDDHNGLRSSNCIPFGNAAVVDNDDEMDTSPIRLFSLFSS
jgi:hypothetical protein